MVTFFVLGELRMSTRQKKHSEETKQAILAAAARLFAERGFHSVTMREIVREAECSHTTIYIYFKDKEDLLHELSMPALLELKVRFDVISAQSGTSSKFRLKEMSMEFVRFCLTNKSMHRIFFVTKGTRVDDQNPKSALNRLRLELFEQIKRELREYLRLPPHDDRLLMFSRIYFFMLYGIVSTYQDSEESPQDIVNRLRDTWEEAFEVLLIGCQQKLLKGDGQNKGYTSF